MCRCSGRSCRPVSPISYLCLGRATTISTGSPRQRGPAVTPGTTCLTPASAATPSPRPSPTIPCSATHPSASASATSSRARSVGTATSSWAPRMLTCSASSPPSARRSSSARSQAPRTRPTPFCASLTRTAGRSVSATTCRARIAAAGSASPPRPAGRTSSESTGTPSTPAATTSSTEMVPPRARPGATCWSSGRAQGPRSAWRVSMEFPSSAAIRRRRRSTVRASARSA